MCKKMFRKSDSVVNCKKCGSEVEIGFSILQEETYEKIVKEMKQFRLCPKCLVKHRLEEMIDLDKILIETAVSMIALGAL